MHYYYYYLQSGDVIETYKILTGKYDIETAPSLVTILGWGWFLSNERSQLEITKIGQNMIYVSFVLLIE